MGGWRAFFRRVAVAVLAGAAAFAGAGEGALEVHRVRQFANRNHPQVLYWFVTQETRSNQRYLADVDRMAADGPFDLVFLSSRTRTDFHDTKTMLPVFTDLVAAAHRRGLKIGLQLWPEENGVPETEQQALAVEGEVTLDARGGARYEAATRNVRSAPPTASGLLRVFAFKKSAEGEYEFGTERDITDACQVIGHDAKSVILEIKAPAELAGYTAYVLTVHYHRYGDLFSGFHQRRFREALQAYRGVGFDGAALDEFKYMPVGIKAGPFRERIYSPAMAGFFRERWGEGLERVLFDMRYAPAGRPEIRVRAVNRYFDTLRQGPLLVEEAFVRTAKECFGPDTFIGVHNTYHNNLGGDEVWHTGLNWWAIPRDYGHTDEGTLMPVRMGIACAASQAVMYNMFYAREGGAILGDAMQNARYNARTHYHAYNDDHGWGLDIGNPEFLPRVAAVEDKIRLLNAFNPPRPALDVLIVFGFPAQVNWLPDPAHRSAWDINENTRVEDKAQALWAAGYLCALAPSYEIDAGKITLTPAGRVRYGDHEFSALVYLHPDYSTPKVLDFLERYTAGGGRLMLEGEGTRDFDGHDARARYAAIAAKATVRGLNLGAMDRLGVQPNPLADGCYFTDGSVVLADQASAVSGEPKDFSVRIGRHTFTGRYAGILALKADARGHIEKFAAGGLERIERDGQPLLSLSRASDLFLQRLEGGYELTLKGDDAVKVTSSLP